MKESSARAHAKQTRIDDATFDSVGDDGDLSYRANETDEQIPRFNNVCCHFGKLRFADVVVANRKIACDNLLLAVNARAGAGVTTERNKFR